MIAKILWAFIIAIIIYVYSGGNEFNIPFNLFYGSDKLMHALAYGLLATFIVRIPFNKPLIYNLIFATLLASIYGLFNEFRQSYIPSREFEIYDGVSNAIGAFIASSFYTGSNRYRSLIELKLFYIKK